MKHLRSFNKINEERSLTFNDVMSSNWEKTFPYDGDGAGAKVDNEGVIFTISEVWDEYKPLAHSMNDSDVTKLYNVLFYSKDMFNLLNEMEDERAKDIVNKILNDKDKPEGRY